MTRSLTSAEDLCLLLQDDALGDLHPLEGRTLAFGLATAALLELAQHDRIDTDLANLLLVDPTPLGDPTADPTLALIARNSETHTPKYWIRRIGLQLGPQILDAARDRLCERGILERDPGDHFFLAPAVAHAKRYPGVEGDSAEEVKVRVMRILFNEEIPQPWEADLIGLAAACRVFEEVLSARDLDRVGARIEAVQSPRDYIDDLKYYLDTLFFAIRRDRPRFMYAHRMPRVRGRIRQLCREVIELHDPDLRKGCPHDVIDAFLELHRQDPQFLPETDLMSAVVGPYIAALDTVAGTLGFAVLRLLSEPEYLEILRAEADALFANGVPNAKDVRALANTHAFVTETLRCYPTTPAMMRTVCNGFEFQGHWVPAGTSLMVATTVVHKDPEYYPDPDRFEIERHLPPRMESKPKGAFAPFGLGPHTCLGGAFGQVQMATVIATMLRYGEFERDPAPEDGAIRATGYPSYRPHRKVGFRLVRRRNEGQSRGSAEPEAKP